MALPDHGVHPTVAGDRGSAVEATTGTAPQEIGFPEIQRLVAGNWKLIALLALIAGLCAAFVLYFLLPTIYLAEAKLLITPLPQGYAGRQTGVGHHYVLAISDSVVEVVNARLVEDGVLAAGAVLTVGDQLDAQTPQLTSESEPGDPGFLILLAHDRSPEAAAAIVNGWARAVVEASRSIFGGTSAGSEQALGSQLEPTNMEIERTRTEMSEQLDELGRREEETTISWDRRISAVKQKADEAIADYNTSTRRLMEETIASLLSVEAAGIDSATRSGLREIAALRAQLARTPRVLTLEKAASDDTMSEMLAEGSLTTRFDRTLVTEEVNPLHDQLAMRALGLESELKSVAGPEQIADVLVMLEQTQIGRSAGLRTLEERFDLEERVFQLRRGRALEYLLVEEQRLRADYERRLKQLTGLADQLSGQLNQSVVSRVLEQVELVKLAAPAMPPQLPVSRQAVIKVAVATFLGGLLGLMLALFRSASRSG